MDGPASKGQQEKAVSSAAAASVDSNTKADQRSPFQTPRKNKTSDRWRRPTNPADEPAEDPLAQEPTPVANNPFLSPVKSTRRDSTQTSLKKAKSYPTPVSDPAHSNPFEDDIIATNEQGTPRKRGMAGDASTRSPAKQAFLFAPSPKRLKSLLEVNSLHASSSRDQHFTSLASPGKAPAIPTVTPRTRARKRLRGEEVDETPEKERERHGKSLKIGSRWAQARTSRLRRSGGAEDMAMEVVAREGEGKDPQSLKRINVWKRNVQEEAVAMDYLAAEAVSDDDDEVLGPTPIKAPAGHLPNGMASGKRLFMDMLPPLDTSPRRPIALQSQPKANVAEKHTGTLEEMDNEDIHATDVTRTPSKAMSRFLDTKPKSTVSPHTTSVDPVGDASPEKMDTDQDTATAKAFEDMPADTYKPDDTDSEEEAVPVEAVDLEEFEAGVEEPAVEPERMLSQKALAKEIVLSDDEEGDGDRAGDGDDTRMEDGGDATSKGGRTLRIESYRYTLQQKVAQQRTQRKTGIFDEKDIAEMQAYDDGESDRESTDMTGPNQPDPFQALSQLSIQSPESKIIRKTMALQQARAKAIFDTRAREKLRAAKRAPVYGAGEGIGGAEENEGGARAGDVDPFEGEGDDDDWESDPEGWKATGLPDDDDW